MRVRSLKLLACAFLMGMSGVSTLRASDIGIDIPASAYDFESEPSLTNGGVLYITRNAPYQFGGEVLGVVDSTATGGWNTFEEFTMPLVTPTSGTVTNLYFSFEGQRGYLYDLDWIRFESN